MSNLSFWTLNGVYTYHTTDAMRVFINLFRENVEKAEELSDDNFNTAFRVWQLQDVGNRKDANQTSFERYGWHALVGNAFERLQNNTVLQGQIDALRILNGLEQVYN